jgi:hypothetical protein
VRRLFLVCGGSFLCAAALSCVRRLSSHVALYVPKMLSGVP